MYLYYVSLGNQVRPRSNHRIHFTNINKESARPKSKFIKKQIMHAENAAEIIKNTNINILKFKQSGCSC